MKRSTALLACVLIGLGCSTEPRTYTNPILAGFYPDPSVCRVGDDYYLVTSTFAYYPGLPVFHSRDLVNWTQIGSVLDRPAVLNLDGQGVSDGLFAPTIRHHDGTFYVTCTLVSGGGNFVVTSKDPKGPWSDPVWIPEANGIDPSMCFDDDGKAYLLYNSVAPDNKPLYDGHRTIRMVEFDLSAMRVTGEERILVNGGSDISEKPVWIEAPHIFKKDRKYFLTCAEGGTADNHSQVVFRSDSVWGPYEPYAGNPILTQRHLTVGRPHPVTTAGHADFVETQNGEWWAVFLACRPYLMRSNQEEYYNNGRETFMAPVVWKEGWPMIDLGGETVRYRYSAPDLPEGPKPPIPLSGNFRYRDDFNDTTLRNNWMFLRTPRESWYSLTERPGALSLKLRAESASGRMNPSFLGHRQQHLRGSASVAITATPAGPNEKAGLLVFQSERRYYLICRSIRDGRPTVELFRSANEEPRIEDMALVASALLPEGTGCVRLKAEARDSIYAFSYTIGTGPWTTLREDLDAKFLNTKYPNGFVGVMYALYATSQGMPSSTVAYVDWFEYEGNDVVYGE
jgi:alpha-N-arabinofuranosidase